MPMKDSPIPAKPANHNYPVIAARGGSGIVQCHLALGWNMQILKNIALRNVVCPQRKMEGEEETPLRTKAARVVRTVTELWLQRTKGGLVAHINHPGNTVDWCVGDLWRRESGDTLAQLMWHNDMAVLYPMKPGELWTDERLMAVIEGGCKLLGVKPGELVDNDDPMAEDLLDDPTDAPSPSQRYE